MIHEKITDDISVVDVEFLKSKPILCRTDKGFRVVRLNRYDDIWILHDQLAGIYGKCNKVFLLKTKARKLQIETHPFLQNNEVIVLKEYRLFHNIDKGIYGGNRVDKWRTERRDDYKLLVYSSVLVLDFEMMEYGICSTKK